MSALTDVVLYTPEMWNNLFSENRLDFNRLAERWQRSTKGKLEHRQFDVETSGINPTAYQRFRKERRPNALSIMLLPIGHCAENVESEALKIIGPAVATRNDIFVFRLRQEPPPSTPASEKDIFMVAVREAELTTSNISRVVLHHSTPDVFFPPRGSPHEWHDNKVERFGVVSHYTVSDPQARIDEIVNGEAHIAIFMGSELEKVRPFDDERLIDVANLNRLVNNIYSVPMFPRAVYAVFASDTEGDGLEAVQTFAKVVNEEIDDYERKSRELRPPDEVERRTQTPTRTGEGASLEDIETILRFTRDMLSKKFKPDRQGHRKQVARKLKRSDFLFYEDVAAPLFYASMIKKLRSIDVAATFVYGSKHGRIDRLKQAIPQLCDHLETLQPCRPDQFTTRVANLLGLPFDKREKERLLERVQAFLRETVVTE